MILWYTCVDNIDNWKKCYRKRNEANEQNENEREGKEDGKYIHSMNIRENQEKKRKNKNQKMKKAGNVFSTEVKKAKISKTQTSFRLEKGWKLSEYQMWQTHTNIYFRMTFYSINVCMWEYKARNEIKVIASRSKKLLLGNIHCVIYQHFKWNFIFIFLRSISLTMLCTFTQRPVKQLKFSMFIAMRQRYDVVYDARNEIQVSRQARSS